MSEGGSEAGAHKRDLARDWRLELASPATATTALTRASKVVDSLSRAGEPELAIEIADAALARATGPDIVLNLRAARANALLDAGLLRSLPNDVVTALLARADELFGKARATDDINAARASARWLALALGLQFHRALHTAVAVSPLAQDPEATMAPFRRSLIYIALTDVATNRPRRRLLKRSWPQARSVVILTTARSHFLGPVRAAAVSAGMTVEEVTLEDMDPQWDGLTGILAQRVVALLPSGGSGDGSQHGGSPLTADVLFVDWALDAAAWASVRLPAFATQPHDGPRLIVRLHSIEALSVAVHVIDWSRVDGVVFVSPFLRRLTHAVLPAVASVPSIVLSHGVSADTTPAPKSDDAWATLGLIGWGQPVKDPLFALDVLRELRQRDPDRGWRLRLVGAPLSAVGRRWDADYVKQVGEALADSLLVGAVDDVGPSDDVPGELERIGFILSTSVREADPHGVVEGVMSGAVPVVRDWPLVAAWGGAREMFPAEWVIDSVEAAADRILAMVDPAATGRQAQNWLIENRGLAAAQTALGEALRSHRGFTDTNE